MTLLAKTQACGILWVFLFFGLELILAFSRVVDLELKQFLGVHEFPNSFWLLWVLFGKGGGDLCCFDRFEKAWLNFIVHTLF